MPRIIVTTETSALPEDTSVLLDESVRSVHLTTDHAASQLVQRLAWAIGDAEEAEGADSGHPTHPERSDSASRPRPRERTRRTPRTANV